MRNLLSNGAMIVAGMVSLPGIVTTLDAQLPEMPGTALKFDFRLPIIRNFFAAAGAPAKDYAHVFLSEADRNALDWRLLPSISFVETTGGKSARNNNLFGWDGGRAVFVSMTDSIRQVARSLGTAARYKDKDLDAMLWAYNPSLAYLRKVKSVMSRIAPD